MNTYNATMKKKKFNHIGTAISKTVYPDNYEKITFNEVFENMKKELDKLVKKE
jgi:hypothetical protein